MAQKPTNSPKPSATLRARHRKSRRGCTTCKVRRVRCDETSPRCRNCESTGRLCDGVAATQFTFVKPNTPSSKANSPISPQPQLSLIEHSDDERRSFNFFLVNVAPLFAVGSLDAAFWCTLIPQLSKSHPTVWDSVVSIALLFEHPFRGDEHSSDFDPDHRVNQQQLKALKWYSRAVSRVARRSDLGAEDEVSAMLSCVLFVALEMQQGNMRQAMSLVEKGVELLFAYLQSPAMSERSSEAKALAEVVIPFFTRHAVFMATLGLPLTSGWPMAPNIDERALSEQAALRSFETLNVQLHSLIYRAHHLIRSTLLILHNREEISRMKMADRQRALLTELKDWSQRFSTAEDPQTHEHAWMSSNLVMYFLVTYTWVSNCLSQEQSCFDAHHEVFEQIVYHATSIINARSASSNHGATSLSYPSGPGIGCIPPLYFTATKCRDPVIRRWALNIIRRAPKRDSIWSKIPTTAILERIIAFEENTTAFNPMPPSQNLPPEHRRVHHVQLLAQSGSIRLFTYADGHPSDPRHLQTHVVSLSGLGENCGPKSEVVEDHSPSFLPNLARYPTLSDLFGNLIASNHSPKTWITGELLIYADSNAIKS